MYIAYRNCFSILFDLFIVDGNILIFDRKKHDRKTGRELIVVEYVLNLGIFD